MKPLVITSLLVCLLVAALAADQHVTMECSLLKGQPPIAVAVSTTSTTDTIPNRMVSYAYREPSHRNFYPVSIAALRAGKARHTHVHISGQVTGVIDETDGDIHVWLCDENARGARDPQHCINTEIIPEFPLRRPKVGSMVRLNGISRLDPEHRWFEVHPVLAIETIPGETK
jgi:hypothetical protein